MSVEDFDGFKGHSFVDFPELLKACEIVILPIRFPDRLYGLTLIID